MPMPASPLLAAFPPPAGYWVHDLQPFLIRFSEHVGIRYYGLAYVLGFAACAWLLHRYHRAGRSPFDGNAIADLITFIVVGVLAGGRLGFFLLYQPDTLWRDPLALVRVWDGGMASHGGFLGVALAVFWWSRRQKVPFFVATDRIVTTAPLGLFFGRLANFINGELWGKVTDVPWAVVFPLSAPPHTPVMLIEPRHPSQLYEAGLEGVLLLAFMQWRFWRSDVALTRPGRLSGEFLLAYAVARALGELFREPDAGVTLILGLSRGTFYSIFLAAAGVALIASAGRAPAASERKS